MEFKQWLEDLDEPFPLPPLPDNQKSPEKKSPARSTVDQLKLNLAAAKPKVAQFTRPKTGEFT